MVMTREYLVILENISGMVRTRLGLHMRGLQHVSYKLDPGFHGYVIFILNNLVKRRRVLVMPNERVADIKFDFLGVDKLYGRFIETRDQVIKAFEKYRKPSLKRKLILRDLFLICTMTLLKG